MIEPSRTRAELAAALAAVPAGARSARQHPALRFCPGARLLVATSAPGRSSCNKHRGSSITVVAVAQRTFQDIFHKTQAQVAWTATGYTLALATVIPLTGWAADRFGSKRLYVLAISLFTAGSALCSTAQSLEMLVAFRVLQGLGGGMLMPLGMTILTKAAGPERLGPGDVRPRRADAARPDLRPHPRRLAHRHRVLALDLPDQRPDRSSSPSCTPTSCSTATRCTRPRPSTSSACCCSRPGWPCCSTGCRRSRRPSRSTAPCSPSNVVATSLIGLVSGRSLSSWWALRKRNIHPLVSLRLFANRHITVAVLTMTLFAMAFFGSSPACSPCTSSRSAASRRSARAGSSRRRVSGRC